MIPTLDKFPRSQRFLPGDRIENTALDVLERLIEATYTRNHRPVLQTANLGFEKLRHLMRLARELPYIDHRRYEFSAREINETGKLIGGWLRASGH